VSNNSFKKRVNIYSNRKMEFDKHGRIILPGKSKKGSNKRTPKIVVSEKIKEMQEVGVIKEKDMDVFPVVANICGKCKHKEAYFWTSQTRSGDEAETRFFKCVKCKYTWREYK
jgi:DNA-directed RNA polymerase subunit M